MYPVQRSRKLSALDKKVIALLQASGLPLLVIATLAVFGLALHDIIANGKDLRSGAGGYWDALMILLTGSAGADWPGTFHLLVKVILGWAAFRIYVETFGLRWDHLKARWLTQEHIVIAAGHRLGGKGSPGGAEEALDLDLAVDFAVALAPHRVVVFTAPRIPEPERARLWESGVVTVEKDLQPDALLEATSALSASEFYAMRDDLAENVALIRTCISRGSGQTLFRCLIEPLEDRLAFRMDDVFEREDQQRIRVFNEAELIASRLLLRHAPDWPVAMSDTGQVHILLIGLGSIGSAILTALLRVGHYRSHKPPMVTVVSRTATAEWGTLARGARALDCPEWLVVRPFNSRVEDLDEDFLKQVLSDAPPLTATYVCTKDELVNLRAAKQIRRFFLASPQMALDSTVIALDPPGGTLIADLHHRGADKGVVAFSISGESKFSEAGAPGGLLGFFDDAEAIACHEMYLEEQSKNPDYPSKASHRPWGEIDENLREDNRHRPELLHVLLRSIGCLPVPSDDPREEARISYEEMHLMGDLEHQRWMSGKQRSGWRYKDIEEKSEGERLDPNLKPYAQLSEEVKKQDLDQIAMMIALLKQRGGKVVRGAA